MPDNPFELVGVEKARPPVFTEIGSTGLNHSGGIIFEEFLVDLKGRKGREIFNEMVQNDPIVGAVDLAIKNLVRQADWDVVPASEDPKDVEVADFVKECMNDMSVTWKKFLAEALTMTTYGWSLFEIVYKRRRGNPFDLLNGGSKFNDNRIGWKVFAPRSQQSLDRWEFDDRGNAVAMIQRPLPTMKEFRIPFRKALHFVTTSEKGNPEGQSVLRKAYRPWFFKKRIEEIEGIGIERDLAGLPTAWVPSHILSGDADAEAVSTRNQITTMLKNVRNDQQAALLLPLLYDENGNKMFEFELLTTKGRRNFDTNAIIMRYNRTIAMSALADFIILGHDNVGSFALASSKTKVFSVAVGSYMDEIADVFNNHAIPQLVKLNGFDVTEFPKLDHGDIETVDLNQLALYINALSGIGMDFNGANMLNYLRSQAGMPNEGVSNELEEPEPPPMFGEDPDDDEGDED